MHTDSGDVYGQLKVWAELNDQGIRVARCTVERPDAVWLTDFTYIRTWEGWSYWQFASHMRQSLVTDALDMALASRQERAEGLIAHSDNGSQYTSYEYTARLIRAGVASSRGRTGTALDNAMGGKYHVDAQARAD